MKIKTNRKSVRQKKYQNKKSTAPPIKHEVYFMLITLACDLRLLLSFNIYFYMFMSCRQRLFLCFLTAQTQVITQNYINYLTV